MNSYDVIYSKGRVHISTTVGANTYKQAHIASLRMFKREPLLSNIKDEISIKDITIKRVYKIIGGQK